VPGEELNAEEKAMQLKIDALKAAAAWPGADQRTPVVLASQLMAAELYQEGYDYFAARPDSTPADALSLALAGAFESRLDGRTEAAIAKLDAATSLDLGLRTTPGQPRWPGSPGCAGRADTAAADLEFVLAVKDQFPPGLMLTLLVRRDCVVSPGPRRCGDAAGPGAQGGPPSPPREDVARGLTSVRLGSEIPLRNS